LFSQGKVFSAKPLIVKYLWVTKDDSPFPTKVGFSVPKKKFKKGVYRNRIKRMMREVWRLHKHVFLESSSEHQLHLFFIFNSHSFPTYKSVETTMITCMEFLQKNIPSTDD